MTDTKATDEKPVETIVDNKSPKQVAGLEPTVKDPDAKSNNDKSTQTQSTGNQSSNDAAFEAALLEKDNELTDRQRKLVQDQLDRDGNDPEHGDDQEKMDALGKKLVALVAGVPETTPDSHILWGAAGQNILMGDLRLLTKRYILR